MTTALRLFDTPYLIAFSTIGCSSSGGKARLLELRRNVDLDRQAVGEARHLDVEIEPLEVDLLGQADVGARIQRQAGAEEGRERQQHRLGAVGAPGHHQRRQRIERVEQEVRIDLIAKGPDLRGLGGALRVGQPALGAQRFGLRLAAR